MTKTIMTTTDTYLYISNKLKEEGLDKFALLHGKKLMAFSRIVRLTLVGLSPP